MTERALRLSHIEVRLIATVGLSIIAIELIFDRYFPRYSHALAYSSLAKPLGLWTIATCLLLPFYVGFEGWWMRRCKVAYRALWIDAGLAIACLLLLVGIFLYGFLENP